MLRFFAGALPLHAANANCLDISTHILEKKTHMRGRLPPLYSIEPRANRASTCRLERIEYVRIATRPSIQILLDCATLLGNGKAAAFFRSYGDQQPVDTKGDRHVRFSQWVQDARPLLPPDEVMGDVTSWILDAMAAAERIAGSFEKVPAATPVSRPVRDPVPTLRTAKAH